MPDYDYLRKIFQNLFVQKKYEGEFDWIIKKKSQEVLAKAPKIIKAENYEIEEQKNTLQKSVLETSLETIKEEICESQSEQNSEATKKMKKSKDSPILDSAKSHLFISWAKRK